MVTLAKHHQLVTDAFPEEVREWRKLAARWLRASPDYGAYLHFVGDLKIERWSGGDLVEGFSDQAVWELMYFDPARSFVGAKSQFEPH